MKLTVIKVEESRKQGQWSTTLRGITEPTVNSDGLPLPGQQVTYYIMLGQQWEIGKEVNINLSNYEVRFQEWYIPEEDKTVILKWLNLIRN